MVVFYFVHMFQVAIIIVNYNFEQLTIGLIKSILKYTSKDLIYQIIVVDNASNKASFNKLESFLKQFKVQENIQCIRSEINAGFGGGNNLGVAYADSDYIAFINSDVIFESDCLTAMKSFMDNHSSVGVSTPQMLTMEGKNKACFNHFISPAYEIFGRSTLQWMNPKKYPNVRKKYNQPLKVSSVAGSFMFFRTSDFERVGGFDPKIFLYYEETDICKRLVENGKSSFLVPDTTYKHLHGGSTPKSIKIKMEMVISKYYVIKKHYPLIAFYLFWGIDIIRSLIKLGFKPKKWPLFYLKLIQAPLSYSLKNHQIKDNNL
tara:strand:+ start:499 stop:1452 length:954 start_codon:yes stop_codon:yes gene_type:complete